MGGKGAITCIPLDGRVVLKELCWILELLSAYWADVMNIIHNPNDFKPIFERLPENVWMCIGSAFAT